MKRARYMQPGILALSAAAYGAEFSAEAPAAESATTPGSVAVVSIRGPLTQHACFVWDDYDAIRNRVTAALASPARAVVLRLDSPGGEAAGVFELAQGLRKAAAQAGKPLVAFVDGQAYSAAYAIACAADRIVLADSSSLGSIGTITAMLDLTAADRMQGIGFSIVASGARKADGNPHVATSDDALAACQGHIDTMAGLFFDLVAKARHMGAGTLRDMEAATFIGKDAVVVGLADEVSSFDDLILDLTSEKASAAKSGAEGSSMDASMKDAVAALRAVAKGEDEGEAKKAKSALKSMGYSESDDDGEKPEKKDDEEKAEGDDDKKEDDEKEKDDAKGDDEKPDAAAAPNTVLALGARIQSLSARLDAKEQAEERARLLASRPDFKPEVRAALEGEPIANVRWAVKHYPKSATLSGPAAAAAAAQPGVQATRGDGQGGRSASRGDYDPRELDIQMGLAKRENAIKYDGPFQVLGVMTPEDSRAYIASQKGAVK